MSSDYSCKGTSALIMFVYEGENIRLTMIQLDLVWVCIHCIIIDKLTRENHVVCSAPSPCQT